MKAVKGVIVRLKGQATSCCCAGQPPFVRGAKTERTPDTRPRRRRFVAAAAQ